MVGPVCVCPVRGSSYKYSESGVMEGRDVRGRGVGDGG